MSLPLPLLDGSSPTGPLGPETGPTDEKCRAAGHADTVAPCGPFHRSQHSAGGEAAGCARGGAQAGTPAQQHAGPPVG